MHRTYRYKGFNVEVNTQPVDSAVAHGTVLSTPAGYVAVVHITRDNITAQPFCVGRSDGRVFGTQAEALMRGYGDAQSVIDRWFDGRSRRMVEWDKALLRLASRAA